LEFQVNVYITGNQHRPAIAAAASGDFVLAWQSAQDGSSEGVFARVFDASRAADVDGDGAVEPFTDGLLVLRYLFGFRDGALISGAVGMGCTRCTAAAIESYIAAKV
jgi:hypothetical protein